MRKLFNIIIILGAITAQAQWSNIPAGPQSGAILLKGATAHLGNGQVIANSVIGFDQGKLIVVADATNIRIDESQYTVIDISGKHVYPGFILPNTNLGLSEVGQVRHTRDYSEQGDMNPNVRALIAYNTDSELIPTMRFNGIQLAQVTPTSGTIPGTSSIVQLDAWNWEDAAYKVDDGVHLNWPDRMEGSFDFATFSFSFKKNEDYEKEVEELSQFFKEAVAYSKQPQKEVNLKFEAMKGLFDGSKTLYIQTDRAKEIIESISFAKEQGVNKIALVGGIDVMMVKDFVKEHNIPVLVASMHRTPSYEDQDVDYPYKLPSLLYQEGIKFCLDYGGSSTAANDRNIPFIAGTAAGFGLPKEEALRAITLSTAEILGIADRTGSLEVGKDANLFVSEGDALDMKTNILHSSYIQGRKIQLNGMQQALFEKYKEKYGHKE